MSESEPLLQDLYGAVGDLSGSEWEESFSEHDLSVVRNDLSASEDDYSESDDDFSCNKHDNSCTDSDQTDSDSLATVSGISNDLSVTPESELRGSKHRYYCSSSDSDTDESFEKANEEISKDDSQLTNTEHTSPKFGEVSSLKSRSVQTDLTDLCDDLQDACLINVEPDEQAR